MKKLAMCVVTYNHATTVDDVLMHCIQDYYDFGIDIYYYDGSTNNETEVVINQYIELGYDNLYYIYEEKKLRIEMILLSEGLFHDYEYIWICKDRSYCPRETLCKIINAIEYKNDIIFLGTMGSEKDVFYSNPALFYHDWAWLATSMDTTIYRRESFFSEYTPNKYSYVFGLHYSLLFQRLAELNYVKIQAICENVKIFNSNYSTSTWTNEIFKVWKDDWIFVNENLPDCYNEYKDYVIKKAASLPWILGGRNRLIELYEAGILVPDKLSEIQVNWERVSNVPFAVVEKIAYGSYDIRHDLDILPPTNSEAYELIKKINGLVSNGTMSAEQIPYAEISQIVQREFVNRIVRKASESDSLILGSIEDLCVIAQNHHLNQVESAKIIQAVLLLALSKSD